MSAKVLRFPQSPKRRARKATVAPDSFEGLRNALPFFRAKRGLVSSWWSATPSDDFQADMQEGRRWARLYLPMLRYYGGPVALAWIVDGMIEAGERNGLVSGFVQEIAEHAAIGAAVAGRFGTPHP
jgi:hypothetical protein